MTPDYAKNTMNGKEEPMHKESKPLKDWLLENSFALVIVLSVLHVLLAGLEIRDSGRVDCDRVSAS